MIDGTSRSPLMSEPVIIPCHFVEGVEIEMRGDIVRLVGWILLEVTEDMLPAERRIVVRVVMTTRVARGLVRELRKRLPPIGAN